MLIHLTLGVWLALFFAGMATGYGKEMVAGWNAPPASPEPPPDTRKLNGVRIL